MFCSSNPLFHYSPLQAGEFRLLYLLPDKPSHRIRFNVQVHNLERSPSYEALSYTWGDSSITRDVLCNDQKINIGRNLEVALKALRFANRVRVLWADAVCINQDDEREREVQVRLMCHIYRGAQRVAAWVGEKSNEDQAVFDLEKFIDLPPKSSILPEEHRTWLSLSIFIRRSWFSRVWIVQELAVARRLTLYCGDQQMDWEVLRKALFKFVDRCGVYINTTRADISLEGIFTLLSIRNLVTEHKPENQELQGRFFQLELNQIDNGRTAVQVMRGDLSNFVKGTRLFGSTDPKDHIFAMLGLVLPEESESVNVNYSRSCSYQNTFVDFARATITQSGSLDVLSQAGLHDSDSLPSWVPDWTRKSQSHSLPIRAYSASGNTRAQFVPAMESTTAGVADKDKEPLGDVLILRGKIIDQIQALAPGFSLSPEASSEVFEKNILQLLKIGLPFDALMSGQNPLKSLHTLHKTDDTPSVRIKPALEKQWRQIADSCSQYPTGQPIAEAYAMTLIGDQPFHQLGDAPQSLRHDCFRIWVERLPENPVVIPGFTSSSVWTGRSSATGEKNIKVDPQLLKLFSEHGMTSQDTQRQEMQKKGMVQVNSSTRFPVYANKNLVNTYKAVTGLFGHQEKETQKEKVAVDDAMTKMGISRLFGRSVERLARNRQFCRTKSNLMGWVPGEAQVGDWICLLEGGRVPYILRSRGSGFGYQFVGEAYVHGVMYGEGMAISGAEMHDIHLF